MLLAKGHLLLMLFCLKMCFAEEVVVAGATVAGDSCTESSCSCR
jgi:hypothetical protein